MASAVGLRPGPKAASEAMAGRASRGKKEGSQGLFRYSAPKEGLGHSVAAPGTSEGTPSIGSEGSQGLGQGGLAAPAAQVLPTA